MHKPIKTVAIILVLLFVIINESSPQVTLSKGWGPGKRSYYGSASCDLNARSTTKAHHALMNELVQLVTCESRAVMKYLQNTEDTPVP